MFLKNIYQCKKILQIAFADIKNKKMWTKIFVQL